MRLAVLSRNPNLYSTSRLVLAGRARGHHVDVIDPLELQIVVARGARGLSHGGRRLPHYHAILPRFGASITSYGAAVLRQFERTGVVTINDAAAIALARDKVRVLELLSRNRIAVPRTVCTRALAGLEAALELVGGCPAIVKLQQGTQGIGTMIAETPQSLYPLLETLWAMGHEIVLQEYVGESAGRDVRALVVGGEVVAAMRRVARPGEFRSNLHRGGTGGALTLSRRYQHRALKAVRLTGLDVAGVDMLEGRDGPIVLEVNCSPGLEGIELASGVDVADHIVAWTEKRHEQQQRTRGSSRR